MSPGNIGKSGPRGLQEAGQRRGLWKGENYIKHNQSVVVAGLHSLDDLIASVTFFDCLQVLEFESNVS